MRDLGAIVRTVQGVPIASMAELQTYAYEIPEGSLAPLVMSRLIAGEKVDPVDLYRALADTAKEAVGDSETGLEIVEVLRLRVAASFPGVAVESHDE